MRKCPRKLKYVLTGGASSYSTARMLGLVCVYVESSLLTDVYGDEGTEKSVVWRELIEAEGVCV